MTPFWVLLDPAPKGPFQVLLDSFWVFGDLPVSSGLDYCKVVPPNVHSLFKGGEIAKRPAFQSNLP